MPRDARSIAIGHRMPLVDDLHHGILREQSLRLPGGTKLHHMVETEGHRGPDPPGDHRHVLLGEFLGPGRTAGAADPGSIVKAVQMGHDCLPLLLGSRLINLQIAKPAEELPVPAHLPWDRNP